MHRLLLTFALLTILAGCATAPTVSTDTLDATTPEIELTVTGQRPRLLVELDEASAAPASRRLVQKNRPIVGLIAQGFDPEGIRKVEIVGTLQLNCVGTSGQVDMGPDPNNPKPPPEWPIFASSTDPGADAAAAEIRASTGTRIIFTDLLEKRLDSEGGPIGELCDNKEETPMLRITGTVRARAQNFATNPDDAVSETPPFSFTVE